MSESVTDPVDRPDDINDERVRDSWNRLKRSVDNSWMFFAVVSLTLMGFAFVLLAWNSVDATQSAQKSYENTQEQLEFTREQLREVQEENNCRGRVAAEFDIALIDYLLAKGQMIIEEGKALMAVAEADDTALQAQIPRVMDAIADAEEMGARLQFLRGIGKREDTMRDCTGG